MKVQLQVLPSEQQRFWNEALGQVPENFVLYGGTAIALRYGHRESVDFDFFSSRPLDADLKRSILRDLNQSARILVLDDRPNSLTASWGSADAPVKLSFFGDLGVGQAEPPSRADDRVWIASPVDLLATKLKAIHDRIEPRDYIDIDCLLRNGVSFEKGLGIGQTMYGDVFNPLVAAKTVAWFKDGGLEEKLPGEVKARLERAVSRLDPLAIEPPLSLSPIGHATGLGADREPPGPRSFSVAAPMPALEVTKETFNETRTRLESRSAEELQETYRATMEALGALPRAGRRRASDSMAAERFSLAITALTSEMNLRGIEVPQRTAPADRDASRQKNATKSKHGGREL